MRRVLISILARVKGNVNANGTIAALTEIKKDLTFLLWKNLLR